MTKPQLGVASLIMAVLVVAAGAVAVRTSAAAQASGFVAGRGVVQAATPTAGAVPVPAAATAPVPVAIPGPRSLPLSTPVNIDSALAAAGYRFPPGAGMYAVKISKEAGGIAYDDFEGGIGAQSTNFWPASSIKVLAAVGALEFVGQQGFTGAATVSFGGGAPMTIKSIYDAAIRVSDNGSYDLLVEIAGVDWLNHTFLTPARGFSKTVIQKSYTVEGNLLATPAITLAEGGRTATIPARKAATDTDCPQGQCSDLYEMSESVRRVVLNNEIPPAERFKLAPADVAGLTNDLLAAEGWFEPAVGAVFGSSARIYGKPGEAPSRDCLDVTLIDNGKGVRLLLSATVPETQGGCPALVTLATAVLKFLTK